MTQEQHIRNLRERRADILDEMDQCDTDETANRLAAQAEQLWRDIELAESELAAKREDQRQHRLEGKL